MGDSNFLVELENFLKPHLEKTLNIKFDFPLTLLPAPEGVPIDGQLIYDGYWKEYTLKAWSDLDDPADVWFEYKYKE